MAKRRRSQAPKKEAAEPTQPGLFRRILKWIISGLTLLMLVVGIYQAFWPVLSFSVGQPTNPRNPFSYPFIAVNESLTPLFFVRLSCVPDVEFAGGIKFQNNEVHGDSIRFMAPKQSVTAPCHDVVDMGGIPFTRGRATIVAYYKVLGIYGTATRRTYRVEPLRDGTIRWLPD
jgi:hypothetical protein